MNQYDWNNFQNLRQLIWKSLLKEQKNLEHLLQLNKDKINGQNVKVIRSRGILSSQKNDRRDYFWIRVIINNTSEYWLSLFYNDIDINTGNMHTQIGRIQFWKNIKKGTPNGYFKENGKVKWYLQTENSSEPKLGPTFIDGNNYYPEKIIQDFTTFINQDIKTKNLNNYNHLDQIN